jgi:hypothetical protein
MIRELFDGAWEAAVEGHDCIFSLRHNQAKIASVLCVQLLRFIPWRLCINRFELDGGDLIRFIKTIATTKQTPLLRL